MARISACMLAFSLFIATTAADQGGFPALLAEPGAAEHHDELMLFGRFVGAWQFKSVEYRDDGSRPTQKGAPGLFTVSQCRSALDSASERRLQGRRNLYAAIRFFSNEVKEWSRLCA